MLYFTPEIFCCLASQIHGHICVMLECVFILCAISPYTTGLKALFNPTLTEIQMLKDDHLSSSSGSLACHWG